MGSTTWRLGTTIAALAALQGCFAPAAIVPLMVVAGGLQGFAIYKTVQLSTGGSVGIRLKEVRVTPGDSEVLRSIKRIAVLPGPSLSVRLAEELMRRAGHLEVMTPAKVLARGSGDLMLASAATRASQLTETERLEELSKVVARLDVDAALIYEAAGMGSDVRIWSFGRPEMTTDFTLGVFSARERRLVWKQPGQLARKIGARMSHNQDEEDRAVAAAIVDKLLEVMKGL